MLPSSPPISVDHKILRTESRQLLTSLVADFAEFVARRWGYVVAPVEAGLPSLVAELIEEGAGVNRALAHPEYKLIQREFRGKIPEFLGVVEPELRKLIVEAGEVGQQYGENLLKLYTSESFKRMAKRDLEDLVLKEYLRSGLPRSLGDEVYLKAWSGLSREMITNMRKGLSPETIAKYAVDRGMTKGLNHILLVARDQSLRAYRQADLKFFETTDAVSAVQRTASHDGRVCFLCLSLDGKIYKVGEEPELHPQDRCDFLPILRGRDPYAWLGGEEWLRNQPESRQKEILGEERYKMFSQGRSLDEFREVQNHPVWGPTLGSVPIREFQQGD